MAYFSLNAYDATVRLDRFLGLQQTEDGMNTDIRYASEVLNVETPEGVLQPHAGYDLMDGDFQNRVETLARFTRRWYTGIGSKEWLVCAAGGKLYARQEHDTIGWLEIVLPETVTAYQCNVWSWVTYEINELVSDNPIDVLLMSNAEDGMIMIIPPDRLSIWQDALEMTWNNPNNETWEYEYTPKWTIRTIDTRANRLDDNEVPKKFGVIERYAERIWGGAIAGEPDMLVYSASYNPTDWRSYPYYDPDNPACDPDDPTTWVGEPEDGAGSIQQPSWDGDSFTALKAFGNQLIAFKEHRVWRVTGTDPGQYVFIEQYGGGAPFPNTIAVDVERILMADNGGLSKYDGMSVTEYGRKQIKRIWDTVNKAALDQMCGCLFKNRYYLSVPVGNSTVNNALVVLNNEEGTALYYRDMNIESLLPTNEELYATSSTLPGRVLVLGYDSWKLGKSSGAATRWVTPWMDFGHKQIQKGGFDMYIMPEVQDDAVTLKISIQTEKKTKQKEYTIQPTEKEHRYKRIHFGGAGRRFRIIIETEAGSTAPWRLLGGLQLTVETDPD